ncbi:hypothetical protein pb186bvf_003180 [Paramecium bursaria]
MKLIIVFKSYYSQSQQSNNILQGQGNKTQREWFSLDFPMSLSYQNNIMFRQQELQMFQRHQVVKIEYQGPKACYEYLQLISVFRL